MKQEELERIRKIRNKHNITIEELSEKLNIDVEKYKSFEEGNDSLSGEELLNLAKTLDFSLDDLIEEDEEFYDVKNNKFDYIRQAILLLLATIFYITYGFVSKDPHRWSCWWVVYLFALSLDSFIEAIIKKEIREFSLILILIGIYVIMGFYHNLWHPGWIIFFVEIIYALFVYKFEEKIKK